MVRLDSSLLTLSDLLASTSAEGRGFAPVSMALRVVLGHGGVILGSLVFLGTQGRSLRQDASDCEQWMKE